MINCYRFVMKGADAFTTAWMQSYKNGTPFVDPRPKVGAEKSNRK